MSSDAQTGGAVAPRAIVRRAGSVPDLREHAMQADAARGAAPSPAGLRAIVDALVPEGDDAAIRERAVAYAAEFTALQLFTAPAPLRWLARIGLAGFFAVTVLRFATTITRLDPARRRRWVDEWAYGPLPPARMLFRAIRSNALLAYFEIVDREARRPEASRA